MGANKYLEFQASGEEVRAGAIRGAIAQGNARYSALVAEAKNQARAEIDMGRADYDASVHQGHDKGAIQEVMATGPILSLMGNTPEITKQILEQTELEVGAKYGRYLKVDRKTGAFQVLEVAQSPENRAVMHELRAPRRFELLGCRDLPMALYPCCSGSTPPCTLDTPPPIRPPRA